MELEYVKRHVLNVNDENYSHGDFKDFWRHAWAWMKADSRKEDLENKHGLNLVYLAGFVGEFPDGHGGRRVGQVVEVKEPIVCGILVEKFFDYMRQQYSVVPIWRKITKESEKT